MLFTVCGPQVCPVIDTFIYFKQLNCPTFLKEPWVVLHLSLRAWHLYTSDNLKHLYDNYLALSLFKLYARACEPEPRLNKLQSSNTTFANESSCQCQQAKNKLCYRRVMIGANSSFHFSATHSVWSPQKKSMSWFSFVSILEQAFGPGWQLRQSLCCSYSKIHEDMKNENV